MPWLCSGTQETWKPRNPRAQETQDSPPEACRKCHRVLPHCRYCWFNTWSTCPHSPRRKAACSRSWTCWEPCPALGQVPAQHPGAAFPRGQCGAYQVPCSSPCGRLYRCNVFFAWKGISQHAPDHWAPKDALCPREQRPDLHVAYLTPSGAHGTC